MSLCCDGSPELLSQWGICNMPEYGYHNMYCDRYYTGPCLHVLVLWWEPWYWGEATNIKALRKGRVQHVALLNLLPVNLNTNINNLIMLSRKSCASIWVYIQIHYRISIAKAMKTVQIHEQIKNHNSLGCERPSGLDVKQSSNAQKAFRPIPGLISCAGVTRSVGITCHAWADWP